MPSCIPSTPVLLFAVLSALALTACPQIELEGRPCDGPADCIATYECVNSLCTGFEDGDAGANVPDDSPDAGPGFIGCDPDFFPTGRCESDELGSWTVRSSCVGGNTTLAPLTTAIDGCPGAVSTPIGTDVSGVIEFQAGGDFVSTLLGDVSWLVSVPSLCTGGIDCGTYSLTFTGSVSCVADDSDGCDCTGFTSEFELSDSGTYTSDGNGTLTLDDQRKLSVCRSADTLLLAETTSDGLGPSLLTTR